MAILMVLLLMGLGAAVMYYWMEKRLVDALASERELVDYLEHEARYYQMLYYKETGEYPSFRKSGEVRRLGLKLQYVHPLD